MLTQKLTKKKSIVVCRYTVDVFDYDRLTYIRGVQLIIASENPA